MKFFKTIAIIFIFCVAISAQIIDSFNISPLLTNRNELEKVFGKSTGVCNCIYETNEHKIGVKYSKKTCDEGWNVSNDTVIEYSVTPKIKVLLKELSYDLKNLYKVNYDDFSYSSIDLEKGIIFSVNSDDELKSISFIPSIRQGEQSKLRCGNAVKYNPMNLIYAPVSRFEFIEASTFLKVNILSLCEMYKETKSEKLYLFIYFSKDISQKRRVRLIRKINLQFKEFLAKYKKEAIVINGGNRRESEIEAFIVEESNPPPTATPNS